MWKEGKGLFGHYYFIPNGGDDFLRNFHYFSIESEDYSLALGRPALYTDRQPLV